MLTVGDKLPALKVPVQQGSAALPAGETLDLGQENGRWKIIFYWPKDFTFVCPTEIAEFGRLNGEFADRDAQVLGASVDNEFVHFAWRKDHPDLRELPFPMLADVKRELASDAGVLGADRARSRDR